MFEAAGLQWFPQLYKIKGGVATYEDEDDAESDAGDDEAEGW